MLRLVEVAPAVLLRIVPVDGLDRVAFTGAQLGVAGAVVGAGLVVGAAARLLVVLFDNGGEGVAFGLGIERERGGEEGEGREDGEEGGSEAHC